jgi:hypothetical protein
MISIHLVGSRIKSIVPGIISKTIKKSFSSLLIVSRLQSIKIVLTLFKRAGMLASGYPRSQNCSIYVSTIPIIQHKNLDLTAMA